MKRWTAVLLLCLMLTGCAAGNGGQADYGIFDEPFQLAAEFTRGALSGSFLYTRSSPEQSELEYISPQSLAGMKLRDESGVLWTEFLGIVHEQESASLKDASPIRALNRALEAFQSEQPPGKASADGEVVYSLSYGAQLVFLGGQLRRIECPADELVITVTGFNYLTSEKKQ